mmetsp:Transcript_17258/g.37512  ORF Transcript_17258/g.37512 Transcript_17258/m.37512 type:complete len:111 (+) Transcript_17258:65-397(+)
MRAPIRLLLVVSAVSLACGSTQASARGVDEAPMVTYIVKCHDITARDSALEWLSARAAEASVSEFEATSVKPLDSVFAGFVINCTPTLASQLEQLQSVVYVERDRPITAS